MFTVLGASGFIGSQVVQNLHKREPFVFAPPRDWTLPKELGHIIYCIGLTADFRSRPLDAMEAHVGYLVRLLQQNTFESLTYLSSTRVYGTGSPTAYEDDVLTVAPNDPSDLYNISKLAGESVCLSSGRKNVRVVRLSNVYGYDAKSENFIFTLIRDALKDKKIVLRSALESSKDHVSVDDVARILPEIALRGKQRIYNIARGKNTTAGQIVRKLQGLTKCAVEVAEDAPRICFPRIETKRLVSEFPEFKPTDILEDLGRLVGEYKRATAVL